MNNIAIFLIIYMFDIQLLAILCFDMGYSIR